jgi:3-dehydrosphinganine reductase
MARGRGHALVTGGSSGIGKATARLLARRGMDVSIVARTESTLIGATEEIEAARAGPEQRVLAFSADVSVRAQAEGAVADAERELGPIDILVTSAGMAHPGYFRELPVEIFERTMQVNYFGTLYPIRAALPAMLARRSGHIVLISSGAGLIGIYGYTPYSPTKFALRGLAESLRGELAPAGIHLSIVYPPDTDTPQLEQESRTKPEETQRITGTAKTWSADGVARQIIAGIDKGRFVVAPGLEMKALARLHSVLAPLLDRYFDRLAARVQRERDTKQRSAR